MMNSPLQGDKCCVPKGWDLTGAQNLVHSTGLNTANLGFAGDSGGCIFRIDFAGASRGCWVEVGGNLLGPRVSKVV